MTIRIKNSAIIEKNKDQEREIFKKTLLALIEEEIDPISDRAQSFLKKYYANLRKYHHMSQKNFINMILFHTEHPVLREVYDDLHPKAADFMRAAVQFYEEDNLKLSQNAHKL